MHLTLRSLIETVAAFGTLASLGFYLLSGCGIVSFLRHHRRASGLIPQAQLPPVSILKPL